MGGRGEPERLLGHVCHADALGKLASAVVARVRPNQHDHDDPADCWQTAYVAGMDAQNAAHRSNQPTSSAYLFLAMQSAVYRQLHNSRRMLRESDVCS